MKSSGVLLLLFLPAVIAAMSSSSQTMTVIQTASTNRPEIRVTVPRPSGRKTAHGIVAEAEGQKHEVMYSIRDQQQLWTQMTSAGPLSQIQASHCMKSASFGTSLFVEVDGKRSPDLSCSNQADARVAVLRGELQKLLSAVTAQRKGPK